MLAVENIHKGQRYVQAPLWWSKFASRNMSLQTSITGSSSKQLLPSKNCPQHERAVRDCPTWWRFYKAVVLADTRRPDRHWRHNRTREEAGVSTPTQSVLRRGHTVSHAGESRREPKAPAASSSHSSLSCSLFKMSDAQREMGGGGEHTVGDGKQDSIPRHAQAYMERPASQYQGLSGLLPSPAPPGPLTARSDSAVRLNGLKTEEDSS